jgi:hypothetical protein
MKTISEGLSGTIAEILALSEGSSVVQAWIKAPSETVLVRLGPSSFLKKKGFNLQEGDSISVKGFRSTAARSGLLIATEIEAEGKTLLLRTEHGQPLW